MQKAKTSKYLAPIIIVLFILTSLASGLNIYETSGKNSTNTQQAFLSTKVNPNIWEITEVVSTESTSDSKYSSLVVDSIGTVHLAWRDETAYENSGSDIDIFYKYKPADGSWSATEVVSTESTSDSYSSPSLAVDSSGTVHVAWDDWTSYGDSGSDFDIFYKYKPAGGSWSETEVVSTESNGYSYCPSLAVDSDGKIHVAWEDGTNYNGSSSGIDIFYKYRLTDGSWSTTEVVSTESTRSGYKPSLAVDSSGTVHVAWKDQTDYNGSWLEYDIFYKYKPADDNWSITEVISTESASDSNTPSLALDSNGTVHIVWEDRIDSVAAGRNIFYKYKPSGDSWSTIEVVSIESTSSSYCPSLFIDSSDMVHVAWTDYMDYNGSGSGPNIFYKYKQASGSWSLPELVSTESTYCWDPSLFVDSNERVHVAWQDDTDYEGSGNDYDIFYKYKMNSNQPPNPPILISPGYNSEPGEIIYKNSPTFQWEDVADADYYGLYISKYPYGSANLVYDSEEDYPDGKIYGTSFDELPSDILEYGEKYRWNMRAHNTNGWSLFSDHLYFKLSDSPQCSLKLEKNGKEIDNIDMGIEFDIHIYDYANNIEKVRFLNDEEQNGEIDDGFIWTDWFDWDTSLDGWNADEKILKWNFYSGGEKEIHAEIKDKNGLKYNCSHAGIYANFYFVHITDTHVIKGEDRWINMVEKISSFSPPPAFVILSGDLVECGAGPEGMDNFFYFRSPLHRSGLQWYLDSEFNIPIYFCPGNHDYREFAKIIGSKPGKGDNLSNYHIIICPEDNFVEYYGNVALFSMNSGYDEIDPGLGSGWPYDAPEGSGLSPNQISWLKNEIDLLDGVLNNQDDSNYMKIIFLHHPYINAYRKYFEFPYNAKDGAFLHNRPDFLWTCLHYDVDVVMFGHDHDAAIAYGGIWNKNGDVWIQGDGTKYVITNAAGEYSAYRNISVNSKGIEIKEMEQIDATINMETSCNVSVHIYDMEGNHVGLNETGGIDFEIPGTYFSSYIYKNDTYTTTSLYYGEKNYSLIIKSNSNETMNLTLQKRLKNGGEINSFYGDVSLTNTAVCNIFIYDNSVDYIIYMDDDGDGNNDREIKPDYFYGNDKSNPNIQILKPENKFYFRNKDIFSFPLPFILGRIEIEIDAFDNISGINYVKIFIDDELKANITRGNLVFNWKEKKFGKHTIKAIAYDYAGNSAVDSVIVRKFF